MTMREMTAVDVGKYWKFAGHDQGHQLESVFHSKTHTSLVFEDCQVTFESSLAEKMSIEEYIPGVDDFKIHSF